MPIDIDHLKGWSGRSETIADTVTPVPYAALAATLDRQDAAPGPGDVLPPLWHWLYFLPIVPQSGVGPDGHPKRGGFLPPVELPRRMWAGGRLTFHKPLHVGEPIRRVSTIADISHKSGRSGSLVFVLVRHEVSGPDGLAITEEQDIVYRDAPQPGAPAAAPQPAPTGAGWRRDIVPGPVLLFRYSALTLNGHRIHYDRPYAMQEEGYPGLVVHGPLIATLLVDLIRRNSGRSLATFRFRAMSPLFDIAPFAVCANPSADGAALWAQNDQGALAMDAAATFA